MSCWHLNKFWESALYMCQSGMAYHSAFNCKSKVIELCIINFTTTSQFTWELFPFLDFSQAKRWKSGKKSVESSQNYIQITDGLLVAKILQGYFSERRMQSCLICCFDTFFSLFFHLHKPKKVNCETTNVKRKAKISNRHWVIARGCTITPSFKKLSIACGSRTDVMKESFQDFFWRHAPSSNYTSLDLWYVFFFLHTISLNWPI